MLVGKLEDRQFLAFLQLGVIKGCNIERKGLGSMVFELHQDPVKTIFFRLESEVRSKF